MMSGAPVWSWAPRFGDAVMRMLRGRAGVIWLTTAALCVFMLAHQTNLVREDAPRGDGHYSWLYARSLAFDGDVDMANDYELCGDPYHIGQVSPRTSRRVNPFYLGPALLWAPALWTLQHVTPGIVDKQPACRGVLFVRTMRVSLVLSLVGLACGALAIARHASRVALVLGLVAIALGSAFFHYAVVLPEYAHATTAFMLGPTVLALVRLAEDHARAWRWLIAGLCVGLAAVFRPSNLLLGFWPALVWGVGVFRQSNHVGIWFRRGALCLGGCAVGLSPLVAVYKSMYGQWWVLPQGPDLGPFLTALHPFLLLFASQGGWLSWHPLGWLALLGLMLGVVRRSTRAIAAPVLAALWLSICLGAGVQDWTASWSFGARRLVGEAPMLVIGTVLACDAIVRGVRRFPGASAAVALSSLVGAFCFCSVTLSRAWGQQRVDEWDPVSTTALYTPALQQLDQTIGNPASLPASAVFAARYGAPLSAFGPLARGGIPSLPWQPHWFPIVSLLPKEGWLGPGWIRRDDGSLLTAGVEAKLLVSLLMRSHSAMGLRIAPHANPCRVDVRIRDFWGATSLAHFAFAPEETEKEAALEGSVNSGVQELLFRSDSEVVVTEMAWTHGATYYGPGHQPLSLLRVACRKFLC